MKGFYNVTKELKTALAAEPFVNTVTFGSLDDVDLNKQTIFPLSHIIVNNTTVGTKTLTFNISILAMDIVDISKAETTDIFVGNDNEQDVLNTQLGLLTRIINILQRGDLYTNLYQVQGDVSCEPFVDRFENKLAGWSATFDVVVQNDMTICS
ncbi:MAG: hypothetical protein Tp1111SUR761211_38 [Prokaryotic dsDNA virus sp.]|nr:MAG: hypothetical protein Tp1111SUR761211_38 [Prokaryotic dsDNA virus sp.]|tara:strand:- start:582 stop:1040 length:459 start_codon:yes stop_codon:yes gene_type:complete